MVKVKKGATKQELLLAVEQALTTREVPLFNNHNMTGPNDVPPPPGTCPPDTLGGKLGPDDAIMIMCKQEGWP